MSNTTSNTTPNTEETLQKSPSKRSNHPPYRILMGPGPSNLHPRVLSAMSRPIVGHLDPHFIDLMEDVQQLLRYAFQTENRVTFPISAPGSTGMECALVNLLEPGDTAIVAINGVFGGRMKDIVERCQAKAVCVEDAWSDAVDVDKVEQALKANPNAKVVAFVHAETSTGALSDAKALCALAKKYDCLSVVDAVTSLAGVPLLVDDWGADVVYSGSQKCLSCVPGISPITFSPKAIEAIKVRKTRVQSWFLDINLMMGYWEGSTSTGKRAYHHTAPINPLYALHEALVLLQEETLSASWQRHRLQHNALRAGLEAMGIKFLIEGDHGLPELNTVCIPKGVDEADIRAKALQHFNLEIGAGLGTLAGKVWRIGLMGHTARKSNVLYCISVLQTLLSSNGSLGDTKASAQQAAFAVYQQQTKH